MLSSGDECFLGASVIEDLMEGGDMLLESGRRIAYENPSDVGVDREIVDI